MILKTKIELSSQRTEDVVSVISTWQFALPYVNIVDILKIHL